MKYAGGPVVARRVHGDREPRFEGDIWIVDEQAYMLAGGRVIHLGNRKI